MSELALRLIEKEKKERTGYLDLGNCGLTELPEELFGLSWLKTLIISNTWWDWDYEDDLAANSKNEGSPNYLLKLNEKIGQLLKLEKLILGGFGDPWGIENLTPLKNLTSLSELYLGENSVDDLQPLAGLTNLTKLTFQYNKVSSLLPLKNLKKLRCLYFWGNLVSDLSPLKNLTDLREIGAGNNKIKDLSPLKKLINLRFLMIWGNQIEDLSPLEGLIELRELNVSNNHVGKLPAFFRSFAKLKSLNLELNKFDLGEEIYHLKPSEQIEAILQWQDAKQAGKTRPILEAKVMFIGDSENGKTHLIEMLLYGKIREDRRIETTHGIERHQLPDVTYSEGRIRVNVWDLGGQDFMRSTHQYFFTERTLYVLVTVARRERKDLNHWLQLAKETGKNSPVLMLINKIDKDDHDIDRESLERDYPNICGFIRTCVYDNPEKSIVALDTIRELRQKISTIISDPAWMPGVFDERTEEWFTVKEELESLPQDYISYSDYEQLQHIRDLEEAERRVNLKLLASLGTVVTFVDKAELSDTHVINPQWLMDGVYKIINDSEIKDQRKGKFSYADLERILDPMRYPHTRYSFLVGLMQSNGLCYPVQDENETFLLPDLFSDLEPPGVWEGYGAMRFRYDFGNYPPDSFITRFMVEHYTDIVDEKRWRSGVVISDGVCSAVVRRMFMQETIEIEVKGPERERRSYLAVIRNTFRKLLKPYDIRVKPEVPWKDVWLNFDHLLSYEENKRPYFHPEVEIDVPVSEILNGYASPEERGAFPERGYFEMKFKEVRRDNKKTHRKLDALFTNTEEILKNIENGSISDKTQSAVLSVLEPLLKALIDKLPPAEAKKVQQIDDAPDLKSKLKLAIPIIPLVLTYETELAWDWNKVKTKLRGLVI